MPRPVEIIRRSQKRRTRKQQSYRSNSRSGFLVGLSLLSLILGVTGIALTAVYNGLVKDLPSLEQLPSLFDPDVGAFGTPTVVFDRTGSIPLHTLGAEGLGRAYLPIRSGAGRRLAPELINAVVAAADPGYWSHPGFSLHNLTAVEPDTIAWKLVSDLLFWDEPAGLRRSLREKLLAAQVVARFGREQVLEWYLNSAYFGHDVYGAEAAARLYFGKSAAELSLAEATVLAATAEAPHLNPFDTPALAIDRRDDLLSEMRSLGYIQEGEWEQARAVQLEISGNRPIESNSHTAFINYVLNELSFHIPREVLYRGGLKIYTTLDADLQKELACLLSTQLERLAGGVKPAPEGCQSARLLPAYTIKKISAEGLAAEGVVMDPRTGQVLAFASNQQETGPIPEARPHAPGSLLTPYIYLSAFTRGFGPASLVWDIPARLPGGLRESPNLDGAFHGPMRIRIALANDYLTPAADLLNQIGPAHVWDTAAVSGLASISGESGMLLFEGGDVFLTEAVHAFSAFSNQGVLIGYQDPVSRLVPVPLRPTTLLLVEGIGGRIWYENGPPQARPVMSAPLAYAITDVLSDETARWDAFGHPNPLEVGRPAGVKTGFTQDGGGAWAVGFTPQRSIGIWIGTVPDNGQRDERFFVEPMLAAGLWHALTKYAVRDFQADGWSVPQGISETDVCDPSGQLPTPECPVIVKEIFLPGNEPDHGDTLFRKFEINRETGLLATVFTPPNLVEEKVYLVPPPEALQWALEAGYEIPPENYDLVSQPTLLSENARLETPAMFSYVGGTVEIHGSAGGPGFRSYSVQVGQGLNPQQWLQLDEPSTEAVESGELASWDTTGSSGLYAVRLLVVRDDSRVEMDVIQVTVDNQPPNLDILYPADGQRFNYPQDESVTVQLSVGDDVLLNHVDVYLNNQLIRTLIHPPYALALALIPGEHILRIEAHDRAGNITEVIQALIVER